MKTKEQEGSINRVNLNPRKYSKAGERAELEELKIMLDLLLPGKNHGAEKTASDLDLGSRRGTKTQLL